MKKYLVLTLLLTILIGCVSFGNLNKLRTENRENIIKLRIGMTKKEVVETMGNKSATDYNMMFSLTANNPYKNEILQGKDKTFEVLYYYTDHKTTSMSAIADDELTPLVFDEGKLLGWGWSFLKDNAQKYEIRFR